MKRKKKPELEKADRTNISLTPSARRQGNRLMKLRGDTKFSRMLTSLIKEDYDRRASLHGKLVRFVRNFDRVFGSDWDHTRHTVQTASSRAFLIQGAYPDWEAHGALMEAYDDLHSEMVSQKLLAPSR
jgi:hypothetical protein